MRVAGDASSFGTRAARHHAIACTREGPTPPRLAACYWPIQLRQGLATSLAFYGDGRLSAEQVDGHDLPGVNLTVTAEGPRASGRGPFSPTSTSPPMTCCSPPSVVTHAASDDAGLVGRAARRHVFHEHSAA